ncbi:porin OmpA [Candidatus Pantoea edessiphila]|nr:porin OmpA [Candidatus Pantoea edessiphila]
MKKIVTIFAVFLAGFSSIVQAASQKNTWYVGGKIGWSKYYRANDHDYTYASNDGPTRTNSFGKDMFVGYQINSKLATELGFDVLGKIKYNGDKIYGKYRAYDLQLGAKLSYPLTDKLDLYTRLGGLIWYSRVKQFTVENFNRMYDYDAGIAAFIAAGVEYTANDNMGIRVDYQFINTVGDKNTVGTQPANSFLTVGLSYKFGQAPYVEKVHINKHPSDDDSVDIFNLKADVLFDFDKFTLKKEGKNTLDLLYDKLKCPDQKHEIIVIGFTDKIGSNSYNQKLSTKRAQSVLNYLVMKGIPSSNIVIDGKGKSNHITENSCNNIKDRKVLINCLAPDRRVEIKITSTKNIINNQIES